jgi:hypothetical protein
MLAVNTQVPRREILSLLVVGSGTEDGGVLRGWRESESLRSLPLSVFIELHLDLFRRLDSPLLILLMVRHLETINAATVQK